MSHVVVINSVTVDGVMQGPGRAEEDTREGFTSRWLPGVDFLGAGQLHVSDGPV